MIVLKPLLHKHNHAPYAKSVIYASNLVKDLGVHADSPNPEAVEKLANIILNNGIIGGIEVGYTGTMLPNGKREMAPLNESSKLKLETLTHLYDFDGYTKNNDCAVMIKFYRNLSVPFQVLTDTVATLSLAHKLSAEGAESYIIDTIMDFSSATKNAQCMLITALTKEHGELYADEPLKPDFKCLLNSVFDEDETYTSNIHHALDKIPSKFHKEFMLEVSEQVRARQEVIGKLNINGFFLESEIEAIGETVEGIEAFATYVDEVVKEIDCIQREIEEYEV